MEKLKEGNWSLGSCWEVATNAIETTPFPKQAASMVSFCDSFSPVMTVMNPEVRGLTLRLDESIKLIGLGNFANVYVEAPPGQNPYLLERTLREDPRGDTLYDLPVIPTGNFNIHLQLEIGMGAMSLDKAWQIRTFQMVGSCRTMDGPSECPLTQVQSN